MKKSIIIIALILVIIISICMVSISMKNKKMLVQIQSNKEYEQYLNKELYGTDVITIINKAMNDNKKNNIEQDEKGNYIDNNQNSINVDLVMVTNEEKETTKTYRMETVSKGGISEFIKNFNTEKFKISKIEYHKQTNKIKYIEISERN